MDTRAELTRFGQTIRQVRERKGISVADLAARTGIDAQQISALEAGRFDPPYDVMCALASGMGVPVFEVIPRAGERGDRARHLH
jgi:transcriptional regulator with XRE-family HTH domain